MSSMLRSKTRGQGGSNLTNHPTARGPEQQGLRRPGSPRFVAKVCDLLVLCLPLVTQVPDLHGLEGTEAPTASLLRYIQEQCCSLWRIDKPVAF